MKKNRAEGSNMEENVGRACGVCKVGVRSPKCFMAPQHSHITLKLDFDYFSNIRLGCRSKKHKEIVISVIRSLQK